MHSLTNAPEHTGSYAKPGTPDDAVRLWRHLHGDRPDQLCLASAYWKGKNGKGDLGNWAHAYFVPDQREDAVAWATAQDRNGREVYFAVAQLLEPRRVTENCAPTRVVHADMDGAELEACPIRPTAVVESSPGHYHAYWRLSRLIQPAEAKQFNQRMAKADIGDKEAVDPIRLMRVPGTHNRKRLPHADVKLLWIDEDRAVTPDELDRILPKLPVAAATGAHVSTEALSEDDAELIGKMGRLSPVAGRLFAGNTSDYANEHGVIDNSAADWGLAQDLVKACAGDLDRAERLMRETPLVRPKWDEPRGDVSLLRYTLQRAKDHPSVQNAMAYRYDDPTTWPELAAAVPDGPANGKCSEHCTLRHPTDSALHRQVKLINQTLQLDVSPIVKLTLLWLMVLVGYAQSKGEPLQTSALSIGKKLKLSAQVIRPVLHGLARNDFTLEGKGDVFRDERGLFDLDSTRVPEAGEFCRVFNIVPLTKGGYTGFLEAAVAVAPDLLPAPKREPRQKHEEVRPPPEVVQIPGCPGDPALPHPMHSDNVVDATCGGEFIREMRYTQNATPYRFEPAFPLWDTSSDTPERFEPRGLEAEDLERLNALYDRARVAS